MSPNSTALQAPQVYRSTDEEEPDNASGCETTVTRTKSLDESEDSFPTARMDLARSMTVFALCVCFTGSNISSFLVGPALPYIAQDLNIGSEQSWIPNASSLTAACLVPCFGYLQDMTGRRVSLGVGLAFTLVGSLIFGTAHSFAQIIAAQVLLGVGSALQELTSIAAIAEMVPASRRGFYLALPPLLSILFAPVVLYANELSTHATWRWILWISLMWNGIALALLVLTYFRMSLKPANRLKSVTSIWDIDFLGIALLTIGLALVLVAVSSGGLTHPWRSAYVIVQLVVGVELLGFFVLWECFAKGTPLVPARLFQGQRVVALAFVIAVMSGFNYTSTLNLGPTIVQQVFQLSAVKDGFVALGGGLGLSLGSSVGNAFLTFFQGRCREVLFLSCLIMTVFTASQASLQPDNPATFIATSTIGAIGIGAALIPVSTLVTLACPQDLIGTGVALIIALRTLGGSIGYSILFNIYSSQKQEHLAEYISPRVLAAGLPENQLPSFIEMFRMIVASSGAAPSGVSPSVLAAAYRGYADDCASAAKVIYLATIAFGCIAMLASACLPDMRAYVSSRVLVTSARK